MLPDLFPKEGEGVKNNILPEVPSYQDTASNEASLPQKMLANAK